MLLSSPSATTRRTVRTNRIAELIMRRDIGFAAGEYVGNIIYRISGGAFTILFYATIRRLSRV